MVFILAVVWQSDMLLTPLKEHQKFFKNQDVNGSGEYFKSRVGYLLGISLIVNSFL